LDGANERRNVFCLCIGVSWLLLAVGHVPRSEPALSVFFEKKRRENTYSGIRACGGFRPWHRDFDNDRAKVIIKKKEEPRDKKVFIHKDY
jgi:hypothetical protein